MIAREVWEHIVARCAPYAGVEMDGLSGGRESVALCVEGGGAVESRYLDGGGLGKFDFAVRVRSDDRERAYGWLCALCGHFSKLDAMALEAGEFAGAQVLQVPHLTERVNSGGYVYEAVLRVRYGV